MIQVLYARRKADSRMLSPILIECTIKGITGSEMLQIRTLAARQP